MVKTKDLVGQKLPNLRWSFRVMPPYHLSTQASSTGGSFIVRESSHNRHRFTCVRDDLSHPYPSAQDVYVRSNTYNSLEEFSNLSLSDFFIARRRVARRKLKCFKLNPFSLGARGYLPSGYIVSSL